VFDSERRDIINDALKRTPNMNVAQIYPLGLLLVSERRKIRERNGDNARTDTFSIIIIIIIIM